MPFRWPETKHDLALAKEVAQAMPDKPTDWDKIADVLSSLFSSWAHPGSVEIKGRGCRERMERLLEKKKNEDAKALKRSGTEEEYTELSQLLEDICTYRRDIKDIKKKQKEEKNKKEQDDREKAIQMRKAALSGMAKKKRESSSDINSYSSDEADDDSTASNVSISRKGPKKKCRVSKASVVEMLSEKYSRKAEVKERELELRKMELDFQKEKYAQEAEERKARVQLEFEERRTMLNLLQKRL